MSNHESNPDGYKSNFVFTHHMPGLVSTHYWIVPAKGVGSRIC